MKEISLHILDIVQNSISASATEIEISINEDRNNDIYGIEISDNGKGIPKDKLEFVTEPFETSRTTRKIGMGLPLFEQSAKQTGGGLKIESEVGIGTKVVVTYIHSHIDRPPMGDISGVICLLMLANPDLDFVYKHTTNENQYVFDSRSIKKILDGIPISEPSVQKFIKEMIIENLQQLQL